MNILIGASGTPLSSAEEDLYSFNENVLCWRRPSGSASRGIYWACCAEILYPTHGGERYFNFSIFLSSALLKSHRKPQSNLK